MENHCRYHGDFVQWNCNVALHALQSVDCYANHDATNYEDFGVYRRNLRIRVFGTGFVQLQASGKNRSDRIPHFNISDIYLQLIMIFNLIVGRTSINRVVHNSVPHWQSRKYIPLSYSREPFPRTPDY